MALLDHALGFGSLSVCSHMHAHVHTHTLIFLLLISRTSFEILAYFCFLCGTSKHIDFKTSSWNFDWNCV